MLDNKEWGREWGRQSVVFYDVTASLKTSRFDEIFYNGTALCGINFMQDQPSSDRSSNIRQDLGVILKVMGLSTTIALLIKYAMPSFPIPVGDSIALFSILLPSAIVALILKFQSNR